MGKQTADEWSKPSKAQRIICKCPIKILAVKSESLNIRVIKIFAINRYSRCLKFILLYFCQ